MSLLKKQVKMLKFFFKLSLNIRNISLLKVEQKPVLFLIKERIR